MRNIMTVLLVPMMWFGGAFCADTSPAASETEVSVENVDYQIKLVKEQIAKYDNLANTFDRKVQNLEFEDYTSSRDAANMRDICRGIAKDLQQRLTSLEQQKAQMTKKG